MRIRLVTTAFCAYLLTKINNRRLAYYKVQLRAGVYIIAARILLLN